MDIIYHFRVKGVGPERVHISGIAGAFKEKGHEVRFVSPTNVDPLSSSDIKPQSGKLRNLLYALADHLPQIGFEILELGYNIVAINKLKKEIKKRKPTFIYERHAFFSFAGAYLASKYKIPIIIEVNEVSGIERVRPQKLIKLAIFLEKYVFKRSTYIVTVSDFLKDMIKNRSGSENILVLPNAVNRHQFFPNELNLNNSVSNKSDHQIIVGFVGYLVHWHRLDLLLKAFSKIHTTHQNTELLLIGDGPLRSELEELASTLSIDPVFKITGRIDHSQIPDYINKLDIALIPNSNQYRSPIKMFEYMAMGKTVIAPDQQPITQIIEDGVTGYIFQNGNEDDLMRTLEKAIKSPDECMSIGERARKLIYDSYTWDKHAEKIISLIQQ